MEDNDAMMDCTWCGYTPVSLANDMDADDYVCDSCLNPIPKKEQKPASLE
jgi:hypothetical protein